MNGSFVEVEKTWCLGIVEDGRRHHRDRDEESRSNIQLFADLSILSLYNYEISFIFHLSCVLNYFSC